MIAIETNGKRFDDATAVCPQRFFHLRRSFHWTTYIVRVLCSSRVILLLGDGGASLFDMLVSKTVVSFLSVSRPLYRHPRKDVLAAMLHASCACHIPRRYLLSSSFSSIASVFGHSATHRHSLLQKQGITESTKRTSPRSSFDNGIADE